MRIGLNTPDPQAASSERTQQSSGSVSSSTTDQVQAKQNVDADKLTLSSLSSKAMETPEIRQEKVDALRQSISSGQYQPNSNESAEAMLSY